MKIDMKQQLNDLAGEPIPGATLRQIVADAQVDRLCRLRSSLMLSTPQRLAVTDAIRNHGLGRTWF